MIYSYILIFLVALIISAEIYFLGKYFSVTSRIFMNNESATIVVGAILYFFITFISFFIFIWIKPDILYFVVIFFIKEVLQIFFLFLRRDSFKGMKVNYIAIGFTAIAMAIIPIMFNYKFNDIFQLGEMKKVSEFQSWFLFQDVFSKFMKIDSLLISKWLMAPLASLLIYNVVSSIIISFSRRKNWFDYFISLGMTIGMILLFNFNYKIEYLAGIFLVIFAVLLSINLIMKSRRRYTIVLGLLDMVIWFFQPDLYFVMLSLSVATAFSYTLMNKSKAFLFWVQLISPILLLGSLWIYSESYIAALFIVILSIAFYVFVLGIGRIGFSDRIDKISHKIRRVILAIFITTIIAVSIILEVTGGNNFRGNFEIDNVIWNSFGNSTWNYIQNIIYYILFATMLVAGICWELIKKNIFKYRISIIIALMLMVLFYNVFSKSIIERTALSQQFQYLRIAAFAPLTFIPIVMIRKKIKL